jgi:hypothetical protein
MKLARYRAVTPGACHASLDRVLVVTPPCRQPLPGHEGTLRRPGQPGIPVLGRPWAPERRQLLGERERGRDRGLLGDELGQEVLLRWRARLRPSQHQPRRPVRGQGAVPGRCHHWQEVAASPLPGCPPVRVAQTLRLARHGGRAPRIARLLERSEAPHGIAATRVPAFEASGCGGREQTAAAGRAALACRPRGRAQVATHRLPATLQRLGHGPPGPPLMVEGPDLLRARQPPRLTWVCWRLGRARREGGWHGDGHRAVGLRHRHLAERLMDGGESLVRRVEHVGQGVRTMLPEGHAIGDLACGGSPWPGPVSIGSGPIPGDHTDAGRRRQPSGHGLGLTIRPEGERSTPLAIKQNGPRRLTVPNGPVVDTEPLGCRHVRDGPTTPQAPEGVATDGQPQGTAEACPGRPCQFQGAVHQPVHAPRWPPSPGGDQRGQARSAHAACAAAIGAAALPHLQVQHDAPWPPGEVRHGADLATMHTPRRKPADRTMHQGRCRGHLPRQLRRRVVHGPGVEVEEGGIGQQTRPKCHR